MCIVIVLSSDAIKLSKSYPPGGQWLQIK